MNEGTGTLGLKVAEKAAFLTDFTPAEENDGGDLTELSLLLTTLFRSAEGCGEILDAGPLQRMISWQPGAGLHLVKTETGFRYEKYLSVTGWEDFEADDVRLAMTGSWQLHLTLQEILDAMTRLDGLYWAGIRDFETSRWNECHLDTAVDSETLHQSAKMALQLDILFKGHGLPRGNLRLDFAKSSLCSWSNTRDDYYMALTQSELPAAGRAVLVRCGQAFICQ